MNGTLSSRDIAPYAVAEDYYGLCMDEFRLGTEFAQRTSRLDQHHAVEDTPRCRVQCLRTDSVFRDASRHPVDTHISLAYVPGAL